MDVVIEGLQIFDSMPAFLSYVCEDILNLKYWMTASAQANFINKIP